jgi:hypothetical protein
MREPRRNHYTAPVTGPDSSAALDAAFDQLAKARNLDATDAACGVHLIASLSAETEARLRQLVAAARDEGCSWAGIADLLGVTRASAWQRWGRQDHQTSPAPRPDQPVAARQKRSQE